LLARWFAEAQIRAIADAATLVMSSGPLTSASPIIVAGIGLAVIAEIARRLGCAYATFDELLDVAPEMRVAVCHCAPAAALASLPSRTCPGIYPQNVRICSIGSPGRKMCVRPSAGDLKTINAISSASWDRATR